MSFFRETPHQTELSALSNSVADLRNAVSDLRKLVLEQDTEIKRLTNERYLREAELADLRTYLVTVLKRVGARVKQTEILEGKSNGADSRQGDFELITQRRAR